MFTKLVRVCLAQNDCDVKYLRENIRQCFIFSVAVRICSRSSYLLSVIDIFAENEHLLRLLF